MNTTEVEDGKTQSGESSMLLDVSDDNAVPYFMWDYRFTVGQIKSIIRSDDDARRIWLMAKLLRDARYADVWKFISLDDFLRYREQLVPRLGRQRDFWEFLYSRWIKQGIVPDADNPHTSPR